LVNIRKHKFGSEKLKKYWKHRQPEKVRKNWKHRENQRICNTVKTHQTNLILPSIDLDLKNSENIKASAT
jgi:hypothetical protein